MPCGCKKGSGMTVHGGGFKRKKRRRKKGGGMGFSGSGALFPAVRAGVSAFRAVRGQRRRPVMAAARRLAQAQFVGTRLGGKRGSGAHFLSGVTWHKGGGMGFSGSGMSFNGSGLRGKRMSFRQGNGRRMV